MRGDRDTRGEKGDKSIEEGIEKKMDKGGLEKKTGEWGRGREQKESNNEENDRKSRERM